MNESVSGGQTLCHGSMLRGRLNSSEMSLGGRDMQERDEGQGDIGHEVKKHAFANLSPEVQFSPESSS